MNFSKTIIKYFLTAQASDYFFYLSMIIIGIASKFSIKRREMLINSIAAIGMLGTFYGICVGLQNFNPNNISESVPNLLMGMKTAFFTSLIGTGGSIFLKILYGTKGAQEDPLEKEFFSHNKLLREQTSELIRLNSEILNSLTSNQNQLTKSLELNSERNNILNKQSEFLSSNNEMLVNLNSSFDNFKKTIIEDNKEVLKEALDSCIKTLNEELNEKIGESFHAFNEGMKRLIDWQEQYMILIRETQSKEENVFKMFSLLKEEIVKSCSSIAKLGEESENIINICENISTTVNKLKETAGIVIASEQTLQENITNITSLNEDLVLFKTSLKETIENTGNLGNNIETISNNTVNELKKVIIELRNYNTASNKIYQEHLDGINGIFKTSLKETVNNTKEFSTDMINTTGGIIEEIKTAVEGLKTYNTSATEIYQKHFKNINETFETTITNLSSIAEKSEEVLNATELKINSSNQKIGDVLTEHVENLQTELEIALNKSLSSLGEELSSLSKKFVSDYGPLTDRLKEIVELSKKVK